MVVEGFSDTLYPFFASDRELKHFVEVLPPPCLIMERLRAFGKGRTVVVVAHRPSAIRHADQIVLLDEGSVAEAGSHGELMARRGKYFELVRKQTEWEA